MQTTLENQVVIPKGDPPTHPTPMVATSTSTFFNFPSKRSVCRGKHKMRYCRITFTFEKEDIESPYFPTLYGNVCRKCGEIERP